MLREFGDRGDMRGGGWFESVNTDDKGCGGRSVEIGRRRWIVIGEEAFLVFKAFGKEGESGVLGFAGATFEDVVGDIEVSVVEESTSEGKQSVAVAGGFFGFLEEFDGFEEEEGTESAFGESLG
jgi:hypothetical protein